MGANIKSVKPQLSREQLAEVIRANVAAFKDEPNFYDYLTELVIYLMEFEYSWPEGDIDSEAEMPTAVKNSRRLRFEFIQPVILDAETASKSKNLAKVKNLCRLCGAELMGKTTCPNCLTRTKRD